MSKEKFEINKIQNPLDVMDIQEIVKDVQGWKQQIASNKNNNLEPAMVAEVTTTLRQSFGKLGITFPVPDSELLMAYQANLKGVLTPENYKKLINNTVEAVDRILLNPSDVEAARYIFAALKDGVMDDPEKPKLEEYKKKFVNLTYSAPDRASMLVALANNPDGKEVLDQHAKLSKQGDYILETTRVYINDEQTKGKLFFDEMLARVGVVGEMPKQNGVEQSKAEAKPTDLKIGYNGGLPKGSEVKPSVSKEAKTFDGKTVAVKSNEL
jgi:hypothetical protein